MSVRHHHLHARRRDDRGGDELVAGDAHHPARQHHRPHPDVPERARGHEVRRLVPGALPRQLRHARREHPGACCAPSSPAAGSAFRRGSADGHRRSARRDVAGLGTVRRRCATRRRAAHVDRLLLLLGDSGVHHHPRARRHQAAGDVGRAAVAGGRRRAARVGVWQRGRAGSRALGIERPRQSSATSSGTSSPARSPRRSATGRP